MATETACRNKGAAILILETISETAKSGTQRAALEAVSAWIRENKFGDVASMTCEERQTRITEIETEMRNCMGIEERRAKAAFYLDGIEALGG